MKVRRWLLRGGMALLLVAFGNAGAEPVRQLKVRTVEVTGRSGALRTYQGAFLQDRAGFIWLGTEGAVIRFDGVRSKTMPVPGMRDSQFVNAMMQDAGGTIWIGSDAGLARVVDGASVVQPVPLGADGTHPSVFTLAVDRRGVLWGGTDRGLFELDDGGAIRWHRHDRAQPDSLASERVYALAAAPDGQLWVGGSGGLSLWSPAQQKAVNMKTTPGPKSGSPTVRRIAVDAAGALWASRTSGVDVWRHTVQGWEQTQLQSIPGDPVESSLSQASLGADAKGRIWIASSGRRTFYRYEPATNSFSRYVTKVVPASSAALMVDRDDVIWFQTDDSSVAFGPLGTEGLQGIDLGMHKSITREDNGAAYVNSLAAGPGNVLWIGGATLRSLDVITGEVRSFVHDPRNPASMTMDDVHSVHVDEHGVPWVPTHASIDRVNVRTGRVERFSTGVPQLDVGGSVWARDGELWSANSAGLVRWDVRRHTYEKVAIAHPDAADAPLSGIAPGELGELLIGCSKGVLAFDLARTRPTVLLTGSGAVEQVFRDHLGRIWVAAENGLFQLRTDGARRVLQRVETGATAAVNAIGEDAGGQLWVALRESIVRFDPATGGAERLPIPGVTSIRRAGSDIYLGSDTGLQRVRAGLPLYDASAPHLAIGELSVDNRPASALPDSPLRLAADNRSFSVEVVALHYADPARNRYRYKLEGFDADWIEVDASRRHVTYAGLPPGEYTLLVKAASAYGVWSGEKTLLRTSIAAPFWQTWSFRSAVLFFVVSLLTGAYVLRTRQLALQRDALETTVRERTRELAGATQRVTELLHNILPAAIADAMMRGERAAPARYEDATVLFTDFSGFTQTVATVPPARLVAELDTVFAAFDDIADSCGMEKIKTIGDAYMAVAGVPVPCADHANRCVRAALLMIDYIEKRNADSSFKWGLRVGIHSGPLVAGIVGKRKYAYDVWGDAVNTSSRLESTGATGRVNISSYTYDLVREEFECEYRGRVEAKGKGALDMYFVLGRRAQNDPHHV